MPYTFPFLPSLVQFSGSLWFPTLLFFPYFVPFSFFLVFLFSLAFFPFILLCSSPTDTQHFICFSFLPSLLYLLYRVQVLLILNTLSFIRYALLSFVCLNPNSITSLSPSFLPAVSPNFSFLSFAYGDASPATPNTHSLFLSFVCWYALLSLFSSFLLLCGFMAPYPGLKAHIRCITAILIV